MANRTASKLWKARTTYTADNGRQSAGGIAPGGGQVPPDTVPPVITAIGSSSILDTSATVTWTTNELATTQVEYGTTTAYGSSTTLANTPAVSAGVTSHSALLSGLTASTTYHYRVKSQDRFNNLATSSDNTFTTQPTGAIPGMSLSALSLWPNYNTIGAEALFSGDATAGALVPMQAIPTTTVDLPAGSTTLVLGTALPCSLPSGTRLLAHNGVIPVLSASAALGATSLSVSATIASIPAGTPVWVSGFQFKKTSDSTWRLAVQPSRVDNGGTDDGTQRWFSGKLVELDPATSYDVRMTVVLSGSEQTLTGTVTTRADSIPTPATLLGTATHFVDPVGGNDSNAGTSSGASWKTISKVFTSAPSAAVVRLAPGWYPVNITLLRSTPITLVGQNTMVTNDSTRAPEADVSKHAIIYSGFQTAPTGTSADPNSGYTVAPWTLYTAASGNTAWKWTAPFVAISGAAGTHRVRTDLPDRIPEWANSAATSVDGMIDVIVTNIANSNHHASNYGWFQRSGSADIYLILPPWATKTSDGTATTNPNDLWITFGPRTSSTAGALIQINANDSRVCGIRFSVAEGSVWFGHYTVGAVTCDNAIFDHNCVDLCGNGLQMRGADPTSNTPTGNATTNVTIQYNLFRDTRTSNVADADNTISWDAVKGSIVLANGTVFGSRLLAGAETRALSCHRWVRGVVIRNNTTDGTFNGWGVNGQGTNNPVSTAPWKRLYVADVDLHDNIAQNCADDGIEPEQWASRHVYARNRRNYTYTYCSMSPAFGGPILNYDDQGWRGTPMGNSGTKVDGGNHHGYKFGTQVGGTQAPVWTVNATWWTDAADPDGTGRAHGGPSQANGGGNGRHWYFYNCIMRATYKAAEHTTALSQWHEDYNLWGTSALVTQTNASMDIAGTKYTTLATYRGGTSQGAHSNHFGGSDREFMQAAATWVDGQLTNPTTGDLSRIGGSALNAAGIPFPNIRDGGSANTPITGTGGSVPDVGHMKP